MRHARRWLMRVFRHGSYLAIAAAVLLGAIFVAAYVLLPRVVEQKPEIEQFLSHETGFQIRIGKLGTFWDGLNPGVHAQDVSIYAENTTQPALRFNDVRVSLATLPLFIGHLRISELTITGPKLAIELSRNGEITVSGLKTATPGAGDAGPVLLAWLAHEGRVAILDGELQFFDHREPDNAIYVRDIDIRLTNQGDRHHLSLTADWPDRICADCTIIANLQGELSEPRKLDGEIYLRADSLNLEELPQVARDRLPSGIKGRVTAELWSNWESGTLASAKGSIAIANAQVPVPDFPDVRLRKVAASFNLVHEPNRFQVSLQRALIQPGELTWQFGNLRYDQRGDVRSVQISRIDLPVISEFVKLHPYDHAAVRQWQALSPVGSLHDVRAMLDGPPVEPREFSFRGELNHVGIQADGKLPAVGGLSGTLAFNRQAGTLEIDSGDLVLSMPKIFRQAFPPAKVNTVLRWQRDKENWLVTTDEITLQSVDVHAEGKLRLRIPDNRDSPVVDLQAKFANVDGSNVRRYVPAGVLDDDMVRWIDSSFLGGHVTNADLVLHGSLAQFPFDQGDGRFEIRAHVTDAAYEFLTGWQPLRQAEANVLVRGQDVSVTGSGRIGSLKAEHITVKTATRPSDRGVPTRVIEVSAEASGPVAETIRLLQAVKVDDLKKSWKNDLPADLEGKGQGWLGMRVDVPASAPNQTRFQGTFRFTNAGLGLTDIHLHASGLNGSVQFNRDGVHSGQVNGSVLGGATTLRFTPGPDGTLGEMESTSTGNGIGAWLGSPYHDRIQGELPWHARWNLRTGMGSLRAEAPTLKNLSLRLPAPLDYENGMPDVSATLRFTRHRNGAGETVVRAGNVASARLLTVNVGSKAKLKRGEVSIGEAPAKLPERDGLELAVRGETLDLDAWIGILTGQAGANDDSIYSAVRGQFSALHFLGRDFGQFAAGIYRRGSVWSGRLAGTNISGAFRFDQKDAASRVKLNLQNLHIPKAPLVDKEKGGSSPDPRRMPVVVIEAKTFSYGGANYGELDFLGRPIAKGWEIAHLKLKRPEADADLTGTWQVVDGRQQSHISAQSQTRDVAATNKALELRGLVGSGSLEGKTDLRWSGSLADFDMARASGTMKIKARDGNLSDVKQGAVRIFGALDITSLLKYLTLDFKPLVEEGFLYKSAKFSATIENGNLYTNDFQIKGPSADINVSGRVGIAAEDLDLVMEVSPHIGAGAALAGWWFFGPQAGAIALAIQQLFKSTGAGVRVVYQVKGPWGKPAVSRVVTDKDKTVEEPVPSNPLPQAGE